MSAEEVQAMQLSDKSEMTARPEADEDARTESSEGSNVQEPEAADSEDEFEDAVEPPSSTSSVLLAFGGAAPPLSGVYEDAVEATDEQIVAALGSTGSEGSEGRQSTIQEESEEERTEKEAATEETQVAEAEDAVAEENTDTEGIEQAGAEAPAPASATIASDAAPEEADPDNEMVDTSEEEPSDDVADEPENIATETPEAVAEPEHEDEAATADDGPTDAREDVNETVQEIVVGTPDAEIPPGEATAATGPVVVVDTAAAIHASEQAASNDVAQEIEEDAVENDDKDTTLKKAAGDESTEREAQEAPVDEAAAVDVANEVTTQETGTAEASAEEAAEEEPVAVVTGSAEDEQADVNPEAEVPNDDAPAAQSEGSVHVDEVSIAASEVEEIVAQVTDELIEAVQQEQDEAEGEAEKEASLEEKSAPESAKEESATEEATPVPEQEGEAQVSVNNNAEHLEAAAVAALTEQKPAEEETDGHAAPAAATAPASAVEEVSEASCRKSSDGNHGVVASLHVLAVPTLGPSSGTTTTTTIEPFVLSSESNELMEVHLPPQRWTYEVFGFSIENRVVYYHIHKSDRRSGIRESPVLKRYTDFRELQIQLRDSRLHAAVDMPRIPRPHLGTVLRGYKSKKTIEAREKAFRALLRFIAQYPALHGSTVFERFITTSRASTGAGWM
ncbi:hypothetical protein PHYPSEUDO_002697 [Phytophthora pseudosyringae]|uniref:PX domain-containing protein n=1 Tax=Phytophthora pseudosyringae TaxID=221518 RepID=A0A8T1WFM0_9STRA|nr:hypothetical protein PHYPSEUDO_002697 [Phytophthora pseudosyringae]